MCLQPSHSKIVKLLFQAGWRTSNRHILALKENKQKHTLICDLYLLSCLPSTWSVNLAWPLKDSSFLSMVVLVSLYTEVTELWNGSSQWVTQSSKSFISSWPLSWLLHCRFSINVRWSLYVHGPHCALTISETIVVQFLSSHRRPWSDYPLTIPPSISPNRKSTAAAL